LDSERGELIHSALEFADVTVERVFTPRVDVAALSVEEDSDAILSIIRSARHSRLPVYEGSIDNIIGVLQIRRYIRALLREQKTPDLRALLDEPCFVHQSASIDELLEELNRRKLSMAIVTDNYGGTMGIVTVEDILRSCRRDLGRGGRGPGGVCSPGRRRCEVSADMDMEDLFDRWITPTRRIPTGAQAPGRMGLRAV
jgi:CBS domain containing-hemolysin-like protein